MITVSTYVLFVVPGVVIGLALLAVLTSRASARRFDRRHPGRPTARGDF